MTHQYQSTNSNDKSSEPSDPRYLEWDKRSRKELKERLYAAIDRRRKATETLIPKVIEEEIEMYGINNITEVKDDICLYSFTPSDEIVMKTTKELINTQINEWKGLRWWRFDDKNSCDTWNKWFKKAKCWQDQNQHKPLGHFWSLIFEELKSYTNNIAYNIFSNENNSKQTDILSLTLYSKCILKILKGGVRFERTRETPLLPVRVLAQSKHLQEKLYKINNGFQLYKWKQNAEQTHKKCKTNKRSNVASILNDKCLQCAQNIYQQYIQQLQQIIPSINIGNNGCNQAYGPSYGASSSVESQRYSPMLSMSSLSPPSIPSPQPELLPPYFQHESDDLQRLDFENKQLRAELNDIKNELLSLRRPIMPQRRPQYRVPIMHDEMDVGLNGYYQSNMPIYNNNNGRRFYFQSHNSMYPPRANSYGYNYYPPMARYGFPDINDDTFTSFSQFESSDNLF